MMMMTGGSDDIFERLDQFSEKFKQGMKAQFYCSFVSSGHVETGKKEATVTYSSKAPPKPLNKPEFVE
jgi:hypothetical protein